MPREPLKRVSVSVRTVIRRINRILAAEGRKIEKCRACSIGRWDRLGDYYVVDVNRPFLGEGRIVERNVDPEALGRELKVLADWETVRTAE
jgi:hypothetical protein